MARSGDDFERTFGATNVGFFFREFSFANNKFTPPSKSEVELADHVVLLDDMLLIFQLKARSVPTSDPVAETAWFEKKVLKDATRQIRDTLDYLVKHSVVVRNERGREVSLSAALADPKQRVVKLVVFDPGPSLPDAPRQTKCYVSKTAGFIHLIAAADWLGILKVFVTPTEIFDYLAARQSLCERWYTDCGAVSEQALTGQFLLGCTGEKPVEAHAEHTRRLVNDVERFDLSWLLQLYADRIETLDPRMPVPAAVSGAGGDYYKILTLLAKLSRTELGALKGRVALCWERCGGKDLFLTRFATESGVGFLLFAVPTGMEEFALNGLFNFTTFHKHECRLNTCIGIGFVREGVERLVPWLLVEDPWRPDPQLELILSTENPLPPVRVARVERYTFRAQ